MGRAQHKASVTFAGGSRDASFGRDPARAPELFMNDPYTQEGCQACVAERDFLLLFLREGVFRLCGTGLSLELGCLEPQTKTGGKLHLTL